MSEPRPATICVSALLSQASREPYDEIKDTAKCVNLMMAAPEGILDNDGEKVHLQQYLTKYQLRGCSDFLFVPGTNDCHIFLIRTEEALNGEITTYCSVIDLMAKVLMEETVLMKHRKFEGCCWVGGFGPFPANGPTSTTLAGEVVAAAPPAPPAAGGAKQSAFVFIKPHANLESVQALVKAKFDEVGISVLEEGTYEGDVIDEKKYIDQHYYAIASKVCTPAPMGIAPTLFTPSSA